MLKANLYVDQIDVTPYLTPAEMPGARRALGSRPGGGSG